MDEKPTILLLEDEPDQAALVRYALREEPDWQISWVTRGEDAIAYLAGNGTYADRAINPFPFLLLLDLKMPGIGGLGVLAWLKEHHELGHGLTKVVLSSVDSSREIELAAELGVNIYWVKADWVLLRQRIKLLKTTLAEADS